MLRQLIRDESGFINSVDYLLLAVLVAIGVMVGAVTLRNALIQEFGDYAVALEQLNQSYSMELPAAGGGTTTSEFDDMTGMDNDPVGAAPGGITFAPPAGIEGM